MGGVPIARHMYMCVLSLGATPCAHSLKGSLAHRTILFACSLTIVLLTSLTPFRVLATVSIFRFGCIVPVGDGCIAAWVIGYCGYASLAIACGTRR